ncbi:hypothetical protein [Caldisalinibacter kiritimatiensis]|uniref:Uncharacterized protein n=1 Tax=Caldisalinibacter kiritimatiensis TaxID=1304284 RepID=R1CY49_9FIRM|nr:hypothetical protein [Caldisalinibacter kiritimatiensis]EOD01494.1 hypothetical protein L21TH_0415 [Caldisalinibacter kiritimatiensis]
MAVLKCRFNKFIVLEYDSNGRMIKRYITVSNTYPVFLKLKEDLEHGIRIPYDIKKRKRGESFYEYIEEVTRNLIKYNKGIYQDYVDDESKHRVLKKFSDSNLEQIIYNGFKLLFLKSSEDLIFLNYIPKTLSYNPLSDYIIAGFTEHRHYHIYDFDMFGQTMKVINTYDAFMEYSKINNFKANLKMNEPFFSSFDFAVSQGWSIVPDKTSNYCEEEKYLDEDLPPLPFARFHYYRIFDKLIVNRYEKYKDTEEIDDVFERLSQSPSGSCAFCGAPVREGDILCSMCANNID